MPKNSLSLPDNLVQMLAAADAAKHFPPGTMASLMSQEVGGQEGKYLADPTAAHYPTGVAPNGKKSSAFGPFGILESTAKDPGYGVSPLGDKTNLAEHVRFAADYLDARARSAGSLSAGLAGYGEGEKYSRQVTRRRDGADPVVAAAPAPVVQDAPGAAPVVVASGVPPTIVPQQTFAPAPLDPEKDPWLQFQARANAAGLTPEGLTYGQATPAAPAKEAAPRLSMSPEDAADLYNIQVGNKPNLGVLHSLNRMGRRQA